MSKCIFVQYITSLRTKMLIQTKKKNKQNKQPKTKNKTKQQKQKHFSHFRVQKIQKKNVIFSRISKIRLISILL